MIAESGAYLFAQFFQPILIDHKFARRRCSAHPDAGNNYLDLPSRIIVHACDHCKIALHRWILAFQVDPPSPAAGVLGVGYPILLLICASELVALVCQGSQGPPII
jgi:hypothetical protein